MSSLSPPIGLRNEVYGWLLGVSFVGSAILRPVIGPNAALVDLVLAVVVVGGLGQILFDREAGGWGLMRRIAPPIWLIVVGSLLALLGVGFAGWAVRQLLTGLFSFAVFIASFQLLSHHPKRIMQLRGAMIVGIVFTLVTLAADGGLAARSEATFPNPNYAGHYLVSALLVVLPLVGTPSRRIAVAALAVAALVFPASFGSLLMLLSVLGYEALRRLMSRPYVLALALATTLAFLWAVANDAGRLVDLTDVELTRGLSADRFSRSQEGRLGTWETALDSLDDEPLGIGPGGIAERQVAQGKEAHNLYIAFLVERGVVGFLGLVWLGVALWQVAPPAGAARRLLIALGVANLFRETLHYRHMWLALAAALAWDHLRLRQTLLDEAHRRDAASRVVLRPQAVSESLEAESG